MDANTQIESYHFLGKADVSLQASSKEPSFIRKKFGTPRILEGTPRNLSSKRKHQRKEGITVSMAATHLTPPPITISVSSTGSDPQSSRGFQEALEETRAMLKTSNSNLTTPGSEITEPTKSRHILIQEKVEAQLSTKGRVPRPQIRRNKRIPPSQLATTIRQRLEKNRAKIQSIFGPDSEDEVKEETARAWKKLERHFQPADVNNNV